MIIKSLKMIGDIPQEIVLSISNDLKFADNVSLSRTCKLLHVLIAGTCNCLKLYLNNPTYETLHNKSHEHCVLWEQYKTLDHEYTYVDYCGSDWRKVNNVDLYHFTTNNSKPYLQALLGIKRLPYPPNIKNITYEDYMSYDHETLKSILEVDKKKHIGKHQIINVFSNGINIGFIKLKVSINYDYGYCLEVTPNVNVGQLVPKDADISEIVPFIESVLYKSYIRNYKKENTTYNVMFVRYNEGFISIDDPSICDILYLTSIVDSVEKTKYIYDCLYKIINTKDCSLEYKF